MTTKQQLACEYIIAKAMAGYDVYPAHKGLDLCIKAIATSELEKVDYVSAPANKLHHFFRTSALPVIIEIKELSDVSKDYIEFDTVETTPQDTLEWMGNNADLDWLLNTANEMYSFAVSKNFTNKKMSEVYDAFIKQ